MMSILPVAPLKVVVRPVVRPLAPLPGMTIRQVGVRLWGEGAYEREPIDGGDTKYKALSRVESDDLIVNKIWARNGSVAVVPSNLAGAFVSAEFPQFEPDRTKVLPRWLHWATKTKWFWQQCDAQSRGTSGKNRIRPERFLEIELPLPPLDEQRRIVARIEELTGKIEEARGLRRQAAEESEALFTSALRQAIGTLPPHIWCPLRQVVQIDNGQGLVASQRQQDGVHMVYGSGGPVGKHNKALRLEPFVVIGRKGSTGKMTLAPDGGWVTDTAYYAYPKHSSRLQCNFLFYALKSLDFRSDIISTAIPGINRTSIYAHQIPVPTISEQIELISRLDQIQAKVDALKALQSQTAAELDALLPSILDKAFKGEL